jgi:hypothetical protein
VSRIVDLDRLSPQQLDELGIADLERLWSAVERRAALRQADPELREAVLRRLAEAEAAGRVSKGRAAVVRAELDRLHPGVVLDAYRWQILDPHKRVLGAFPRAAGNIYDVYRREPRRLIAYMQEIARFTRDEDRLLRAAADFAEQAGIPDQVAEDVLVEGLRAARAAWAEKGGRRGR